ncbi:hypothetical protein INT44_000087 [Umbelopsis vinacea]|uniref:RGS domain-containing protein n=1 Tax=Umbelopsis vinacea TaxID=44442 RepID=A0A8H7PHD4_9FUNG|nr:hypothetical protein INT44_000087 [Umbelopsis vinacea]
MPFILPPALAKTFARWFTQAQSDLQDVSLETILKGNTCQPISMREFKLFLQNKEHSAENLDFYYWFIDYSERFYQLPEHERAMSMPPTEKPSVASYALPLETLIKQPSIKSSRDSEEPPSDYCTEKEPSELLNEKDPANQPFREEVNAVLRTFFNYDSEKELNIDGYLRRYIVYHANRTTHPEVFAACHAKVYQIMEQSSLRNFLHHALQNIRYDGIVFRYSMGFFFFLSVALTLTLTFLFHTSRWYRLFVFPCTFGCMFYVLSGRAGMCFRRALRNKRQVPLYELDQEHADLMKNQKRKTLDIESVSDMKSIIDPHVLNYNKLMFMHTFSVSALTALSLTIMVVSLTNEPE